MRVRYDRLAKVVRPQVSWTLVHCWSQLRRRFVKLARNSKSPIAEAAVHQIAQLYAIEATVRGSSQEIRLAARREHSQPIIAALKPWFENQLSMISSGSTLAEDIRYALNHWSGLTRVLDDGRIELGRVDGWRGDRRSRGFTGPAAFASCRCRSSRHSSVSSRRSSNRTCRLPVRVRRRSAD
ncbi:IS66 family transposase [Bradyrhizobium niftali]|jgi:Transposase IS66 family|uniref:IS66 family transposase n=1 Tax=Bradyrhizobium niftali TaxID=2560055 RepID=UPI001F2B78C6|nr:transposase [Bradyrhizobium niftali]